MIRFIKILKRQPLNIMHIPSFDLSETIFKSNKIMHIDRGTIGLLYNGIVLLLDYLPSENGHSYLFNLNELKNNEFEFTNFFIPNEFTSVPNGETFKFKNIEHVSGFNFRLDYGDIKWNILYLPVIYRSIFSPELKHKLLSVTTSDKSEVLSLNDSIMIGQTERKIEAFYFISKGFKANFGKLNISMSTLLKYKDRITEKNTINKEELSKAFTDKTSKFFTSMKDILDYKNYKYGNAALEPIGIFNKESATTGLTVRIDDKLARVMNSKELRKNDIIDLIGYLSLLSISKGWTDLSDLKD